MRTGRSRPRPRSRPRANWSSSRAAARCSIRSIVGVIEQTKGALAADQSAACQGSQRGRDAAAHGIRCAQATSCMNEVAQVLCRRVSPSRSSRTSLPFYKYAARQEADRRRSRRCSTRRSTTSQQLERQSIAEEVMSRFRAEMKKGATTCLRPAPRPDSRWPIDVDLFVIGAGSGGVRAARIAPGYGARVMVAEEYRVGGTCVIRGCVPKKLLVYASRFADEFEDAAGYGWTRCRADVRLGDADRQQGPRDRPARGRLHGQSRARQGRRSSRAAPCSRMPTPCGCVDRRDACAPRHILIATGGAPSMGADIAGIEHVISSNEAFHLTELPQAHPDPGRRLYRGRVRRHLRRARLAR